MSSPALTNNQIVGITEYINMYRAKHSAPPLSYNDTIASFSNQWSNYLLSKKLFQHSGTRLYGENLAYFEGYGKDIMTLLKLSIDAWYNEISSYDFNSPKFSDATGHFTCLVWLASTEFGISIALDDVTSKAIITMNTSPPGNVIGQFQQNVLPLVKIPIPTPTPIPTPIPTPTPTPTVNTTQIRHIITTLHNIIYFLQKRQPCEFVLHQLNSLMNYILISNIPNNKNIVQMLQLVMQNIQNRRPTIGIIIILQNIIIILQNYILLL